VSKMLRVLMQHIGDIGILWPVSESWHHGLLQEYRGLRRQYSLVFPGPTKVSYGVRLYGTISKLSRRVYVYIHK
jgi:hypothetical protein